MEVIVLHVLFQFLLTIYPQLGHANTILILQLHPLPKVIKQVGGRDSQIYHAPDHKLCGKYLPPRDGSILFSGPGLCVSK